MQWALRKYYAPMLAANEQTSEALFGSLFAVCMSRFDGLVGANGVLLPLPSQIDSYCCRLKLPASAIKTKWEGKEHYPVSVLFWVSSR